ncbi:TetR/AcrR family transcriptional regulator [Sandaracinus amylolyticus]|uniref:TetR/AcrR family transcriptional regulator n=1 Tax=Sandaracinus amylolyticus TaxID=927083 RepID=UPI001F26E3FB|nr:TetR/AcrR family transcriptional regulator [Sandaracinus amylolyticus]
MTPRQDRARASVDAIVAAAEIVLREEGFARTTTNRIAKRAGVNVGLVYRYFAGKEAIVGAITERVADVTFDAIRSALEAHASSPLPVALRAVVMVLVDTPGVDPRLHRELVEHLDVTRRRAMVQALRARTATLFAAFLDARRDTLRPDLDREALVFVIEHAMDAATHAIAFYRPAELDRDRAIDALVDLLSRALLPTSRA